MQTTPISTDDFRLLVVQKLTHLETMMAELAGNGQPGRIQRLEDKVRAHDRLIWMTAGAGVVLGWLLRQILA
jgi:NAD(P)H-dependent FMN reductase